MPATRVYIGIDDTDNETSIGTGKLARNLSDALEKACLGVPQGVTRHQLLVDPRIPYTSHNSAAALVFSDADRRKVADFCGGFLRENFHPGADPGLCVAGDEALLCLDFGRRAQREVLDKSEALDLSRSIGCILEEHGGTGGGVIGALSAVGLRASENDGFFLDFGRCRMLEGMVTVADLLKESGADTVRSLDGEDLSSSEQVDTQGWVRPHLLKGRTVILVERNNDQWRTYRRPKTPR